MIGIDGQRPKERSFMQRPLIVDEYIGDKRNPVVNFRTCGIKCSTSY